MAEQQEMNIFKSYSDGMKNVSEFFQKNKFQESASIGETFRILSKSATAGIEIYDAWLEGLHDLTQESFTLCRKVIDGEKADTECILNATSRLCENVTNRMMGAAKDTPFEAIEPSLQAIQKSMDFKKNGYMMKALLQPGIDMSILMMKMFKTPINGISDFMDRQGREA